jgi:flagellar motor switch protein FliM
MDDLLSQNEIDALLNAMQSGDLNVSSDIEDISLSPTKKGREKIRKYDFRRPEKFSKDQTRTIQNIHDTFARLVVTYLSAQLRSLVKMSVVSVDQLAYEEFIRSVSNPTIMGIFNMGTLEGNCILEMNLTLAFSIIDRLFGGAGTVFEKIRPLTEIEEAVIKKIMSRMLLNLREAWIQVYEINPKLLMTESNPQFTQIVGPNEMVVLISFEMKIHEVEGMVNLCIPGIVLEPIAQNLSASVWYATIKKSLNETELEAVKKKLYDSELEVIAELGSTMVVLKDLLELKEGDYIKLDNKTNQLLKIKAGSRVKFLGKPGRRGKQLAVEIKKVLTEEEASSL